MGTQGIGPYCAEVHHDSDKRRIFLYGYGSPRVTVLNSKETS